MDSTLGVHMPEVSAGIGKATLAERLPMAHPSAVAIRAVRAAHGAAARVETWTVQLADRIAARDYLESGRLSFEIRAALRRAERELSEVESWAAATAGAEIADARARLGAIAAEIEPLLDAAPVLEQPGAGSEASERAWRNGSDASWERDAAELAPRVGLSRAMVRFDDTARAITEAENARGVALADVVYLHPDRVKPGTTEGREVLAHELVHLAQSRTTPTATPSSRRDAEREAGALARRVARGESVSPACAIDLSRAAADEGDKPGYAKAVDIELLLVDRDRTMLKVVISPTADVDDPARFEAELRKAQMTIEKPIFAKAHEAAVAVAEAEAGVAIVDGITASVEASLGELASGLDRDDFDLTLLAIEVKIAGDVTKLAKPLLDVTGVGKVAVEGGIQIPIAKADLKRLALIAARGREVRAIEQAIDTTRRQLQKLVDDDLKLVITRANARNAFERAVRAGKYDVAEGAKKMFHDVDATLARNRHEMKQLGTKMKGQLDDLAKHADDLARLEKGFTGKLAGKLARTIRRSIGERAMKAIARAIPVVDAVATIVDLAELIDRLRNWRKLRLFGGSETPPEGDGPTSRTGNSHRDDDDGVGAGVDDDRATAHGTNAEPTVAGEEPGTTGDGAGGATYSPPATRIFDALRGRGNLAIDEAGLRRMAAVIDGAALSHEQIDDVIELLRMPGASASGSVNEAVDALAAAIAKVQHPVEEPREEPQPDRPDGTGGTGGNAPEEPERGKKRARPRRKKKRGKRSGDKHTTGAIYEAPIESWARVDEDGDLVPSPAFRTWNDKHHATIVYTRDGLDYLLDRVEASFREVTVNRTDVWIGEFTFHVVAVDDSRFAEITRPHLFHVDGHAVERGEALAQPTPDFSRAIERRGSGHVLVAGRRVDFGDFDAVVVAGALGEDGGVRVADATFRITRVRRTSRKRMFVLHDRELRVRVGTTFFGRFPVNVSE